MLVNASVDRWRRLRHRPEEPLDADESGGPAVAAADGDAAGLLADRDLLLRALAVLPPGQRAVVVLRYFEDLTEAQTAAALSCSVGSVKSQSSRALARLRTLLDAPDPGSAAPGPAGAGPAAAGRAGSGREDEVRHGRV